MQLQEAVEMSELQIRRVGVMLHRHLQSELELVGQFEALSQSFNKAVNDGGVKGPALEASEAIAMHLEGLERDAEGIRRQRVVIITAINQDRPADLDPLTVRQFIELSDAQTGLMLSQLRNQLLDRINQIHASMLGSQAVMFYSHEFNKRIVSALIGSDVDESQYGVDGQATGIRPGNIIRKAC